MPANGPIALDLVASSLNNGRGDLLRWGPIILLKVRSRRFPTFLIASIMGIHVCISELSVPDSQTILGSLAECNYYYPAYTDPSPSKAA